MEFDLRLWNFISTLDFGRIKELKDCENHIFTEHTENYTTPCFQLHCTNTQGFISTKLYDEHNEQFTLLSMSLARIDDIHDVKLYHMLRSNL